MTCKASWGNLVEIRLCNASAVDFAMPLPAEGLPDAEMLQHPPGGRWQGLADPPCVVSGALHQKHRMARSKERDCRGRSCRAAPGYDC